MTGTQDRLSAAVIADVQPVPASLNAIAVTPADARYRHLRSSHVRSGAPSVILQPKSVDQVGEAVRYARSHNGPLSIRSGGHGFSGRSTNTGGVVIDLSELRDITVIDHPSRRVRIQAGATWGAVATALTPLGWALSSGDHGGVGVGGLATPEGSVCLEGRTGSRSTA